jgi:hypothetical protein
MEIKNHQLEKNIDLGSFKLFIDNGSLYAQKGRETILISPSKFGLNEFSINVRLLKVNEEEAYIFDSLNKAF